MASAVVVGTVLAAAGAARAADTPGVGAHSRCDPALSPSTNHPFAYVDRGDRCEGVYVQLVGSTTLTLQSFTATFDPSALKKGQPLVITWPKAVVGGSDVHLRAISLRRRLFYRMDTEIGVAATSYIWPTDVLDAIDLGRPDIGLLGWMPLAVGHTEQQVLLPLNASQATGGRTASATYTVLVRPATELTELFLTITRLTETGGAEQVVQPAKELGYGYYPAENSIEISIDAPAERGVYAAQLGAKLRGGGASTLRVLFQGQGR